MGYMRHHAIVVTSWSRAGDSGSLPTIEDAREAASGIFPAVSEVLGSEVNGYGSFFIPPDGSKMGWSTDEDGDARRKRFIEWLKDQGYEDGSSPFDWAEIQYGDDERETIVTAHSDEPVED